MQELAIKRSARARTVISHLTIPFSTLHILCSTHIYGFDRFKAMISSFYRSTSAFRPNDFCVTQNYFVVHTFEMCDTKYFCSTHF